MISEDYDHRWEPLAEVHFNVEDEELSDDNYIYCLCSRVFIRDGVKLYYMENEEGSESEVEMVHDSKSLELEEHSHVHFSLDTSYKVKCEKDEGASCYCSATHTDNYCSTDEHDPAQNHGTILNVLQPSDSGADLTYQECHSDFTNLDKPEKMDQDIHNVADNLENYMSENTWEKFWSINGERIIWASWIKKYSDYINPAYLDENNDLMEETSMPKDNSADHIYNFKPNYDQKDHEDDTIRERKFSYDSKVNPYKKNRATNNTERTDKNVGTPIKDDTWLPIGRRRSCSEHDRMLSPRTLAGTDSMTNVTKITLSSYDVTSSHVTSESSPEDYSVSTSTSDDPTNDQTRITNIDIDEALEMPSEEIDTDQYWQFLWKKHFGEQYALHFANYLESHVEIKLPVINVDIATARQKIKEKLELEYENSDGNSQEMPTVIEVQTEIDKIKLEEKAKPKKRNKKATSRYVDSVGFLLQNLLKDDNKRLEEVVEAGEQSSDKKDSPPADAVGGTSMDVGSNVSQPDSYNNSHSYEDDGGDEPPENRHYKLKRSHEIDQEEEASQKIKTTFEMMGLCLHPETTLRGQLVYRKRYVRPPRVRSKKLAVPTKTYFDDEGNPCVEQTQDSQEEREMQTDEDSTEVKSDCEKEPPEPTAFDVPNKPSDTNVEDDKDVTLEALSVPLPTDLDSDNQENDALSRKTVEVAEVSDNVLGSESTKRRRRKRRRSPASAYVDMPEELAQHPNMLKYWKKRHSLFNRYDEGIKLDVESWFSVTPEKVARHLAERCRCDLIVDAFCGAGGNAIQFAYTCERVIAIDIDPCKIALARHNAEVYGVQDRIQFVVGDFFHLAPTLRADVVFLSPPWGGPQYAENAYYDLETMLEPRPSSELLAAAESITHNVALYVPRNSRSEQLVALAKTSGSVEIEQNFLGRRFIALTAYYGDLVNY